MREQIQEEAIKSWEGDNTIVVPTGVGKTKIGIEISKGFQKILVVVPKVNLKQQWEKEFKTWEVTPQTLTISTRNSAHKITEEYDLVIFDEIHSICTDTYQNLFSSLKRKKTLGLTATVPEKREKLKILEDNCPVCFSKELEDVKDVVAEFQIYNIPVELTRKEKAKYKIFSNNLAKAQRYLSKHIKENKLSTDSFTLAKESLKDTSELGKAARLFWSSMTMRRQVLNNGENKVEAAINLIKKFPTKKWILFNESIELAEKIEQRLKKENLKSRLAHSKLSKEENEKILEGYSRNEFNILNSVKSLIEGTNVPDIEYGLCVSGNSTKLPMIQSLGRIIRKKEGKLARYYNLYHNQTQEQQWVKKKSQRFSPMWVKSLNSINI